MHILPCMPVCMCPFNFFRQPCMHACIPSSYVTVFWITDHVVTNTEIHFLPVDESHTHALSRDTKHLSLDGQVCFCRRLFSDDAKPRGYILWPVRPLRGINKTAWGAKLILTAGLVYQVSCARLGHPLMAQHCHLCLNVCFSPPTAPHPPLPPTPPPSHPPTPYRLNPRYYSRPKKIASKTRGVQIACGISYEILAI